MVKRTALSVDDELHRKKQKLNEKSSLEIQSPRDLQRLLVFEQDAGTQLRRNIQTFKVFLDSTAYGEDSADRATKRGLLLEYLQSQSPRDDDKNANFLSEVIQTWSYATQSNNEGLFSAVAAVLALILKTVSSFIDFREHGNSLCKTLMQKEQIKLFDRGMSANKSKEYIISPCLRLLTEVVSFDGGKAARSLYLQRDTLFQRLDVFLGMRSLVANAPESQRRPSVRNNALRYLLANLRLQDQASKSDILAQGRIIHAVFQGIKDDPPDTVLEILVAFKKDVIRDDALPRAAKSRLLTDWVLGRVATLYSYEEGIDQIKGQTNVQLVAHEFLLFVCTTLDQGALVNQTGWYPPGTNTTRVDIDMEDTQASVDTTVLPGKYQDRVPVRNTTLSSFLQSLRPYANLLQSDLILAIFRAAPELVADYFFKKKSFSFEPKLTSTWIGYSAFLFSAVQLPIPDLHGDLPPPISIIIESILPQPLNKKVLTRCLNQNANLITFFAIRILTAAFKKLQDVLIHLSSGAKLCQDQHNAVWKHVISRLVDEFCRRCPEMKHAVAVFRNCPEQNQILREAIIRLLAMYYKIVPQIALEEKFDISAALSIALNNCMQQTTKSEVRSLRRLDLDHLLDIASHSPDIRWWQKHENTSLSPFTTLLKLHVNSKGTEESESASTLLRSVIREHALLKHDAHISSFEAFIFSLKPSLGWRASDPLYEFIDNCILRFVRQSVKYFDVLSRHSESIATESRETDKCLVSPLLVVITEQWPFLIKTAVEPDVVNVTFWLARYLDLSMHIGEDLKLLSHLRDQLRDEVEHKDCQALLEKALKHSMEIGVCHEFDDFESVRKVVTSDSSRNHASEDKRPSDVEGLPSGPLEEDENHSGLSRWVQRDVPDAISDGSVGQLILCLCSKYEEIRKQALIGLRTFTTKLEDSGYSEWQPTYVLLGELSETAKPIISKDALPHFAGALAARSLSVLASPLHFMYGKINKFLSKGPRWNVGRLASYWVDRILLHPPLDDDTHYREVEWLLDGLMEGLQTTADMESYRRSHIFERLLSMAASPSLPEGCNEKILLLLNRCTYVGGSTILITRCGLLSWIQSSIALKGVNEAALRRLALLAYETCDQEHVHDWSKGAYRAAINNLGNLKID